MSYREQHISAHEPDIYSPALVEEIAWTEARCNRLIRNITSRVEALRKIVQPELKYSRDRPRSKYVSRRPGEHWSTVDPAWLPDRKSNPQGRTYSRKKKSVKSSSAKGEAKDASSSALTIPSPFVKGLIRGTTDDSDHSSNQAFSHENAPRSIVLSEAKNLSDAGNDLIELQNGPKRRRSRQLPIKPASAREAAELGLLNSARQMLKCTADEPQLSKLGARSLLQTCIRRVPSYIELDEQWRNDSSDHEGSPDVLSALEERMGSTSGWFGLKEIARSQCVGQIRHAVSSGLVSDDAVFMLADACCNTNAVRDAEEILHACLQRAQDWRPELVQRLCGRFPFAGAQERLLQSYAQSSDHILAELIRMPGMLRRVLQSTSSPGVSGNCDQYLLQRWADLQMRRMDRLSISTAQARALSKGMLEIFSKLCAMAVASSLVVDAANTFFHGTEMLHRFALEAVIRSNGSISEALTHVWTQACLVLESLSIRMPAGLPSFMNAARNLSEPKMERKFRDAMDVFTLALAEDIATLDGQILGQPLVGLLIHRIYESLRCERLPAVLAQALQQLASQSVIALSPRSDEQTAEDYTEKVVQIMAYSRADEATIKTPHHHAKRLRWEDDIAEWISRTPFTPAVLHSNLSDDKKKKNNNKTGEARSGPKAVDLRSPDILANTPLPVMRKERNAATQGSKRTRQSLVELGGFAHPQVIIPRHMKRRRRSIRVTMNYSAEGSEDELGL